MSALHALRARADQRARGTNTRPLSFTVRGQPVASINSDKRSYVLGGTAVFSLAEMAYFTPKVCPNGCHSTRDFAAFGLLCLIAVSFGYIASTLAWHTLKRWFER